MYKVLPSAEPMPNLDRGLDSIEFILGIMWTVSGALLGITFTDLLKKR